MAVEESAELGRVHRALLAPVVAVAFAWGWLAGRVPLAIGWIAGRLFLTGAYIVEAVIYGFREGAKLGPKMPPELPPGPVSDKT